MSPETVERSKTIDHITIFKRTTGQTEAVWNETHSFHGLNNISCSDDKLSAEKIATRLSSINLGGGQTNNGPYFLVANTCVQMKLISGAIDPIKMFSFSIKSFVNTIVIGGQKRFMKPTLWENKRQTYKLYLFKIFKNSYLEERRSQNITQYSESDPENKAN